MPYTYPEKLCPYLRLAWQNTVQMPADSNPIFLSLTHQFDNFLLTHIPQKQNYPFWEYDYVVEKRKIRYKTSLSFKLLLFMLFRCWGSCSSRSILLMKQEPGTSKSTIDWISADESFGIKFNSKGLTVTIEKKLSGKTLHITLSCLILAKTSCFFLEISFLAPQNAVRTTKVFLVTEHFLERLKDHPVRQSSN